MQYTFCFGRIFVNQTMQQCFCGSAARIGYRLAVGGDVYQMLGRENGFINAAFRNIKIAICLRYPKRIVRRRSWRVAFLVQKIYRFGEFFF